MNYPSYDPFEDEPAPYPSYLPPAPVGGGKKKGFKGFNMKASPQMDKAAEVGRLMVRWMIVVFLSIVAAIIVAIAVGGVS